MKTNDNPQAAWGGTPGEELFDVLVYAPGWLREEIERHGPITGCHLLVVYLEAAGGHQVLDLQDRRRARRELDETRRAPVADRVPGVRGLRLLNASG